MSRRFLALTLALPFCLGGCQLLGQTTNMVVQLLNVALSMALAIAPFALSYYLYKDND